MINVVQITASVPHMKKVELWYDIMELPPGAVNNLEAFLNAAKLNFPGRKVRIIQVLEQ